MCQTYFIKKLMKNILLGGKKQVVQINALIKVIIVTSRYVHLLRIIHWIQGRQEPKTGLGDFSPGETDWIHLSLLFVSENGFKHKASVSSSSQWTGYFQFFAFTKFFLNFKAFFAVFSLLSFFFQSIFP